MTAAHRVPLLLAGLLAGLIAVQPVLGGVGDAGRPAVGRVTAQPALDLAGLAPGRRAQAVLPFENAGSAPGTFTLAARTVGSKRLARQLRVTVLSGTKELYAGPLAELDSTAVGRVGAGERRSLTVQVELPRSAGNAVQGQSVAATFAVTATASG